MYRAMQLAIDKYMTTALLYRCYNLSMLPDRASNYATFIQTAKFAKQFSS
ncbi:MAG: hypothetical protein AB4352_07265 [Hormoscilla sp.]